MKLRLLCLSLLGLLSIASASATQIIFYSEYGFTTPGSGTTFSLELGTFNAGFTPQTSNLDDWLANWNTDSTGYLDTTAPEWSAALTFGDNSLFGVGQQLYLWAYDVRTPAGAGQWALFAGTTSGWFVPMADPLALDPIFLEFDAGTQVILGRLDIAGQTASSAPAVGLTPVPEPSTYAAGAVGLALALLGARELRRRRRAP